MLKSVALTTKLILLKVDLLYGRKINIFIYDKDYCVTIKIILFGL